ncbi:hypothetical protein HYDPIDRAFT_112379 [Hydnomerulius pinastri MD-312]|uniref:Unplaced genomic scaffold scaffold_13, whole genome shotgun sequence n=1 Tax=Hydnomerulius pinastri MD-312 TaxID=994086 RepID=A0A0C9VFP9_9AGAM|nr:hypothetical protein HYDPIDRAFT_112379 [Hydnomerulius pinastri MD-312]
MHCLMQLKLREDPEHLQLEVQRCQPQKCWERMERARKVRWEELGEEHSQNESVGEKRAHSRTAKCAPLAPDELFPRHQECPSLSLISVSRCIVHSPQASWVSARVVCASILHLHVKLHTFAVVHNLDRSSRLRRAMLGRVGAERASVLTPSMDSGRIPRPATPMGQGLYEDCGGGAQADD